MISFLDQIRDIAIAAGREIMAVYATDFAASEKADGSALTEADERAERLILAALAEIDPATPVLAEEQTARGEVAKLGQRFYLVDPLDGTKEFVSRTHEFTVNIALIEDGLAIAGVVLAPALGTLWAGARGQGAWRESLGPDLAPGPRTGIAVRQRPSTGLVAVASRSHRGAETDALLSTLGAVDFTPAGSSLKFCLVAEGKADVYPRLGRTMEWDTGAGQAVLEAAGGRVNAFLDGREAGPLRYGKADRGYDNPHFIAWGG